MSGRACTVTIRSLLFLSGFWHKVVFQPSETIEEKIANGLMYTKISIIRLNQFVSRKITTCMKFFSFRAVQKLIPDHLMHLYYEFTYEKH